MTQRGAGRFVGVTQATGVQRGVGVAGLFQATEAGQPNRYRPRIRALGDALSSP